MQNGVSAPRLSPDVSDAEWLHSMDATLKRYSRKIRTKPKIITQDPSEIQRLTEFGYKMKAERHQIRRDKKRRRNEEEAKRTGKTRPMRGESGYVSSSSESDSSHSSVSYGGVPEQDLEHVVDVDKKQEIYERRNQRRVDKW